MGNYTATHPHCTPQNLHDSIQDNEKQALCAAVLRRQLLPLPSCFASLPVMSQLCSLQFVLPLQARSVGPGPTGPLILYAVRRNRTCTGAPVPQRVLAISHGHSHSPQPQLRPVVAVDTRANGKTCCAGHTLPSAIGRWNPGNMSPLSRPSAQARLKPDPASTVSSSETAGSPGREALRWSYHRRIHRLYTPARHDFLMR